MRSAGTGLATLARRFAPPLAFIAVIAVWEFSCWFFAIPAFLLPATCGNAALPCLFFNLSSANEQRALSGTTPAQK